jgi:hypothetical protein
VRKTTWCGRRAGDTAAFRLLVERHWAARARAERLRDPDRFGAWLAGMVRNVQRRAAERRNCCWVTGRKRCIRRRGTACHHSGPWRRRAHGFDLTLVGTGQAGLRSVSFSRAG